MSRGLTWRRAGLLLQSASLACVGVALATFGFTIFGRDRADDVHGYGFLFGSIYLAILSVIGVVGVVGITLWWRTGQDTPVLASDVFVTLFAAQFLQPALDELRDASHVDLAILAPWMILTGFLVLTVAAALVVFGSRPATPQASIEP